MRSLLRALDRPGWVLPTPWPSLSRRLQVFSGNLMVVIGATNVGKSLFSLAWATGLKEPTLVASLDTDARTQAYRVASNLSGSPLQGQDERAVVALQAAGTGPPVRWAWEATLPDMEELIRAEADYWGTVPSLVVIDNMDDVVGEESFSAYAQAFNTLKRAARRTNTVIMALHHINKAPFGREAILDGTAPLYLRDAQFSGHKQGAVVLGLWRPEPGRIRVGILKNRFGAGSTRGHLYAEMGVDLTTARVTDDAWRQTAFTESSDSAREGSDG